MAFFPLFIDLLDKDILVVGAGKVGSRRIETLVSFDASVTVVSVSVSDMVQRLADEGKIKLFQTTYRDFRSRCYEEAEGGFSHPFSMVLTATGEQVTDEQVLLDGRRTGALVNVAGKKEDSDFYFPGIAKTETITAGVIAGGKDHYMAKKATEEVGAFLRKTFIDRDSQEQKHE